MIIGKPILEGKLHFKSIEAWYVAWETNKNYRHWCVQKHPENFKTALVVLFNPGSLNSNPNSLNSDSTLRVLRNVFHKTGVNPLVINLFDYYTPSYRKLNLHWEERDYKYLVYEKLLSIEFIFSIYAYGLMDKNDLNYYDIISRINFIKSIFKDIPVLNYDDG